MTDDVITRLAHHVAALERLGLQRARLAFAEHECPWCDATDDDADCLAAHVGAVVRAAHEARALDPDLAARVEACAAVFDDLVALEDVPLEAPLIAAFGSLPPAAEKAELHVLSPSPTTPSSTSARHLGFIAALAAALLAGLLAWWWWSTPTETAPSVTQPPACDPEALRRAVDETNAARAEHPAWFGDLTSDHGLGLPRSEQAILSACPGLPRPLRVRLAAIADLSYDRGEVLSFEEIRETRDAYAPSIRRICADETALEDPRSIVEGCRLHDVGLGDATASVYAHTKLDGFVLYRFLLDDGITPDLARAAVLLWVYPDPDAIVKGTLATVPHADVLRPGILVRVTPSAIEVPGRGGVSPSDTAGAWLDAEREDAFGDELEHTLLVDADRNAPAIALVDLARLARAREMSFALLVRDRWGKVGIESVYALSEHATTTYVVTQRDGLVQLATSGGTDVPEVRTLDDLERWALGPVLGDKGTVAIDVRGLTVQQLVDVRVALRGRECSGLALVGEEDVCATIGSAMTMAE